MKPFEANIWKWKLMVEQKFWLKIKKTKKQFRYFLKAYFQILLKADVLKGKLYFKPMTQVNKKYSRFLNMFQIRKLNIPG